MVAVPDPLVARCVAGEPEAWRELHDRHYRSAYLFLRRLGVRGSDTSDACQEVFVQVFRYLARFEGRADLRTWIYKLCLSQAARVRRRAKLISAVTWLFHQQPERTQPGPEWSETEVQRRVYAALAGLKTIHREVFVLYELEGLSGTEIAAITGLPHATVRRRLHHARRCFEAAIQERPQGEAP